jgi:short-subunit dehydrogenase
MATGFSFRNKAVLITGASAGIGASLARELSREQARLVLVARRRERLEGLRAELEGAGGRVLACVGDVTRAGELESAVAQARERFGGLDAVFANAGFGVAGPLASLTLEDYRRQFETNVFGVLRTVFATLGELRKSRGRLVVVGSVSGHVSLPGASAYSMSKFAVRALAEALREELRGEGIGVTLISPGFVESEFRSIDNYGVRHPGAHEPIPRWLLLSSDKASRQILRAARAGRKEAVITGHGKLIVFLKRHFPLLLDLVIRGGIRGRKQPGHGDPNSIK